MLRHPDDHASHHLTAEDALVIGDGIFDDAFAVLGPRDRDDHRVVRLLMPGADSVTIVSHDDSFAPVPAREWRGGLFTGRIPRGAAYRIKIVWPGGHEQTTEDPYAFGPLLSDFDLHLFREGRHFRLAQVMGSVACKVDGVQGVRFSVWAPNARRVAVVGDFNAWDRRRHGMRPRHEAGVWEIFIPRIGPGEIYKYEIIHRDGGVQPWKADPLARSSELPPRTGSRVAPPGHYAWTDGEWMASRGGRQNENAPLAIYEVHITSWLKGRHDGEPGWDAAGDHLLPYVKALGFTHIELLPVAEYPFGGSWGYQPLGLFAPTARMGDAESFARFVDRCHREEIGVIVDWVPAHFPNDVHGMALFDGTALYEHADPQEGFHIDWNTLIYNFGRHEVQGFLIASAIYWLEHFHVDGLRVDAVASMLYRDYSRQPGQWRPNIHGGRENLEAVAFLRHLNAVVHDRCPGAITIAEESTAWPGVTAPLREGGLGFDFKWNMGWMHDTLHYMERDPVHRSHHHDAITFGLVYAFSEKFVLPLSHDEVVHGKGSLIGKMPGDDWQRLANLRLLYALMWTHPGKKLLFMGAEFAQEGEWSADNGLEWHWAQERPQFAALLRDLNAIYRAEPALHVMDSSAEGFRWMIGDDAGQSVFAFTRHAHEEHATLLVVANMTPVPRPDYAVPVPAEGGWREIFNSDSEIYGGVNIGNGSGVPYRQQPRADLPGEVILTLPPLGLMILKCQ